MIESPSGRVPEKAPRWDLTRTEACGGRKVFLVCPLVYGEYLGIYGAKIRVRVVPSWPTSLGGATLGRASRACGPLMAPLASSRIFMVVFWSKKNRQKVSFRFDSIWYWFSIKDKNNEKAVTGTGHWVNRLVPKNDIK